MIVFKSLNSYCNTFRRRKSLNWLFTQEQISLNSLARHFSFLIPPVTLILLIFFGSIIVHLSLWEIWDRRYGRAWRKDFFSFFFGDLRDGIFLHKFLPQLSWLHASLAGLRQSLPNPMTINIINSSCSHPDEVFINTKLFIILSLKRSCCYGLLIFFIIFIYLLGGTLCVCAKCVPFSPFSA